MKVYGDTNLFTNLWVDLSHSEEARDLMVKMRRRSLVLPVTRLLRMEMTNALQRLVYEARNGVQGVRMSPELALMARASFDSELTAGDFLEWRTIPDDELELAFETLAFRHTAKGGFRTYDILHVASALLLGCDTFWSFDVRVRKLARIEGLRTNE
jgi:predicted nucleic acid-binding protein